MEVETEFIDKRSPSISRSFFRTSTVVVSPSLTVAASACATGASLIGVISKLIFAVLVAPKLSSTRNSKLSVPKKSAFGLYLNLNFGLSLSGAKISTAPEAGSPPAAISILIVSPSSRSTASRLPINSPSSLTEKLASLATGASLLPVTVISTTCVSVPALFALVETFNDLPLIVPSSTISEELLPILAVMFCFKSPLLLMISISEVTTSLIPSPSIA